MPQSLLEPGQTGNENRNERVVEMPGLGVNVDHIATIREARKTFEPDPVLAAVEAESAGARGITFHLRKDRRHISDRDARLMKDLIRSKLNMEMSMDEEIVAIALDLLPDQITLVPEKREEITTEGGLDCIANSARLAEIVKQFRDVNVTVSAFIDPKLDQVEAANNAGVHAIELHTGCYANECVPPDGSRSHHAAIGREISKIEEAIQCASIHKLEVHAGHGLTYQNVFRIAALEGLSELNIGHSIIARAAMVGIHQAVVGMKKLVNV